MMDFLAKDGVEFLAQLKSLSWFHSIYEDGRTGCLHNADLGKIGCLLKIEEAVDYCRRGGFYNWGNLFILAI
jgi:hypothetical protein